MINRSLWVYSEEERTQHFQVVFVVNLWLVILPIFQLIEWDHTAPKQIDYISQFGEHNPQNLFKS